MKVYDENCQIQSKIEGGIMKKLTESIFLTTLFYLFILITLIYLYGFVDTETGNFIYNEF